MLKRLLHEFKHILGLCINEVVEDAEDARLLHLKCCECGRVAFSVKF